MQHPSPPIPEPVAAPAGAVSPRGGATRAIARLFAPLDRLHVKLFAAIAGANVVLALVAYAVFSWSFDRGFVEYLNRADETRLTPLVARLADEHERHGSWDWVADDREQWIALVREVLGTATPSHGGAGPDPLLTIDPRLMLFDSGSRLLVGRASMAGKATLRPIVSRGTTVGHLGYVPRLEMVESLERVFSAQQGRKYAAIAFGMLAAALLVGALLSWWLARRIRTLGAGAAALIQGDYSARVVVDGNDELAQLGDDLNRLADSLEAARRARQQWIADIAHELRTPLATLRAEIEALQDGVRPLGMDSLGSLEQEVGQLSRLVEDLHLLSMSDLGALSYHRETIDVGESIDDALYAHRHLLRERGIATTTSLAPGVFVLADATRIAQVFGNLLQNTLRYTDAPGRLEVRLERDGAFARVTWEDSSPGVEDADLARLTDRLFRLDASRSRAGGGSGLGLAIVAAIVEAHSGELHADRSALGGLRWTIVFPAAEGEVDGG